MSRKRGSQGNDQQGGGVPHIELKARTAKQQKLINALYHSELTIVTGPAGTGKTFVSASVAAKMLVEGKVDRIVITRPAIEISGDHLGFLPGTINEKFLPFLIPFEDAFTYQLGNSFYEYLLKSKKILPVPLAYIRGRTFDSSIVILDEAQNTTISQMKAFLTRAGQGAKMVINGDMKQSDITGLSGLQDAVERLYGIPEISQVHFEIDDIVRSGLCRKIVEAYEN